LISCWTLEEETVYDPATGLPATRNLADYHVPVHADIHGIDVYFVGEPDYAFNPIGARGMGEIALPVRLRRWRMRSITRRENAYAICRSRQTNCYDCVG
jgi:hypothetical protein